MPEDEVTPALAPAKMNPFTMLSPLALPSKGVRRAEPAYPDAFNLDGPLSPTGKAAASALCVLSGGRLKAAAPLALLVAKRSVSEEEDEVRARFRLLPYRRACHCAHRSMRLLRAREAQAESAVPAPLARAENEQADTIVALRHLYELPALRLRQLRQLRRQA
jgi:hypothetical protein